MSLWDDNFDEWLDAWEEGTEAAAGAVYRAWAATSTPMLDNETSRAFGAAIAAIRDLQPPPARTATTEAAR